MPLNDGHSMPVLGLGVYGLKSGWCIKAVHDALRVGYRHFDTAKFYGNEAEVGRAVVHSGIARDQIFVATKLWDEDQGYEAALRACDASLARLDLEYIDLYLIHWPKTRLRLDSWRALVELRKKGKCRSIGVSNFTIGHLTQLLENSDVVPSVNQVEFSPFLYQRELLTYCSSKGIQLVAYGALTRGAKLTHPVIARVAKRHGKTPAQVMLRWAVQHKVVVIPKSSVAHRIEENAQIFDFELQPQEMNDMDHLDCGFRASRDPSDIP